MSCGSRLPLRQAGHSARAVVETDVAQQPVVQMARRLSQLLRLALHQVGIAQLDDQRAGRHREAAEQATANPAGGGLTGQVRTTRTGHVGHRSCLLSLAAPDAISGAGPPLACPCSGAISATPTSELPSLMPHTN